MKQNSFISVILTVACSLMFVACSDWTEPTPVDYNPIFPDEQDHSLYEKYEQSLKEYKNRKHTLMLIRFANNPGTTSGEQDFLRSLPDSVDFVVLTNADNLSVYDQEDVYHETPNGPAPNFSITRIYPNSTTNAKRQKTWKNSKRK